MPRRGLQALLLKRSTSSPGRRDTLLGGLARVHRGVSRGFGFSDEASGARAGVIVACGTSWHAGLVGKFLIERLARIPSPSTMPRSTYRDRSSTTVSFPSSSVSPERPRIRSPPEGSEVQGNRDLAICNVRGSMVTVSRGTIYTHAGPEIGVASTKAFTSQITASRSWRSRSAARAARCPRPTPRTT